METLEYMGDRNDIESKMFPHVSFECDMLNKAEPHVELTLTNFRFSPQKHLICFQDSGSYKMGHDSWG